MEKKGVRSVQGSTKGQVTEIKKNQDGTGGKLWPRNSRRREPAGGSFPAKNETSRKPNPQQRYKPIFNKQPRARSDYPGRISGREETGIDEDQPELGSVMAQGSKKQNLNHLLNFQLAPHESHYSSSGSVISRAGHRWNSASKHKYNKEQFLQANCQFVVKSSGDYRVYMNNPDALVDWDLIEQVNVHVVELPSCPICLYSPVAAKMTRCGHIYCWSCVLHYLALSEKTWGKCPICFEAIHRQDLKSVVSISHRAFNLNETITFKLMKKLRGSLIAYPVDEEIENPNVPFNFSNFNASTYCKLLCADKTDVLNIIERERNELNVQVLEDPDSSEKCFIEQAVTLLGERENFVIAQLEDQAATNEDDKCAGTNNNETVDAGENENTIDIDNNLSYTPSRQSSVEGYTERRRQESETSNSTTDTKTSDDTKATPQQTSKYIYFYQASDGQHIYLHSINAKMLEHTYGSLEYSPKTITGRILEKESWSMTEEVRKRNRYLNHLPVTCQFEMVEIHLSQPTISRETKEYFQEQVQQRQKRRQRRAKDEKRREKRITEEENRKIGKYPVANIKLESRFHFPEFEESLTEFGTETDLQGNSWPLPTNEQSSASPPSESSNPGVSFAKMLSSASKKPPPLNYTQKKSDPEQPLTSTPGTRLINVTGSHLKTSYRRVQHNSDSEPENDDYVPAPTFSRSLCDDLAVALERASFAADGEVKTQKGKKKKKQKVLFSTHMPYV